MILEATLVTLALALALAARPWRLYRPVPARGRIVSPFETIGTIAARLGPAAALLAVLPFAWTLPGPAPLADQLHWSGAALATLMLGWPVAVPLLVGVAVFAAVLDPAIGIAGMLALACWQGVLPATLSLAIGVALRRGLGEHLFIYLLGQAFLGTVVSVFVAALLERLLVDSGPQAAAHVVLVGRWLMAWADGIVTGMLVTVFVAFAPAWLATWSDARYLGRSQRSDGVDR